MRERRRQRGVEDCVRELVTTLPADIRVNVRAPFPSQVQGAAFVQVSKANGLWTVAPNYQLLAEALGITATQILALYDTAAGLWSWAPATAVGGAPNPEAEATAS